MGAGPRGLVDEGVVDAPQITQDAIDLGELFESDPSIEENDLPDGDMHGMSHDRRELNDSPLPVQGALSRTNPMEMV